MTYATAGRAPRAPGSFRSPFSDINADQVTVTSVPSLSGSFAASSAIQEITETPWERALRRARSNGLGEGGKRLSLSEEALSPLWDVVPVTGIQPILLDAGPVLLTTPGTTAAGAEGSAPMQMTDARRAELLAQYKADQDQLLDDAMDFILAYSQGARHQFWYHQTGRREAPPEWWRPPGFFDDDPSDPSGVAFYALAHGFTDYDSIAGSGSGKLSDIRRAGADRGNILPYMTAEEYAAYYNNNPQRPPQPGRFASADPTSEWYTMQIPETFPPGAGTDLERPASGSYAGFNPGGTEDDVGDPTYTSTHTSIPNPDDPNGPPIIVPISTVHPDAPPGYDPLDHPGLEPAIPIEGDVPLPTGFPVPTTTTTPPTTTGPTGGGGYVPPTGGNGNGGVVPTNAPPAQAGGLGMAILAGGLVFALAAGGKKKRRSRRR